MIGAGPWLLTLGCALCACGAVGLALCVRRHPGMRRWFAAYMAQLGADVDYLRLRVTARAISALQLAMLVAPALAALASRSLWPLAVALAAALLPQALLRRARNRRTAAIERQLGGFLLALANGLRANPALSGALAATAELTPAPLAAEVELALRKHGLGVGLDRALAEIGERTRSPVVGAALAVLRIARESGGDLSRTLETAAASLREMARLEGVVRTKTAEGRAQVAVITIAPFLLIGTLHELDPDLLEPLWSTSTGRGIAGVALLSWAAALLLARKIVAVDI